MAMTPEEKAEFEKIKKELEELKASKAPKTAEEAEKLNTAKREEAELQKRIADATGDIQKSNQAALEIEKERLKLLQTELEVALTENAVLSERAQELVNKYGSIAAAQEEINKLVDDNNRLLDISKKQGKEYRNTFESIAAHIGMSNRGAIKMVNSAKALGEELKDNAEKQAEFARAFVSTFNVTNAIAAVFTSFAESMVRNLFLLDQVASNFAAATGAGRGFTGVIQEAQANSRGLGVSLEESGKATQALFEGFIGFTNASEATQTALAETTAQLGKFGVDGQSAVNILNFFSTNLGKSTEESARLTKQLAMMGPRIGISTAKITKDFQAALPTLAVYGDRSIEVFQGLAGAARMAGVETSKLLDLAAKFDTFSDSAETAGKLNAILGTQISSTEMLMMTENERIESLIRSVQTTGVAFDQLGRFEQKAIAAAAGISDLSEAQRIFGMSLTAFRDQQREMDKSAKVQEEFNKALQDMLPLKEKFMSLFARFVPIVTPALELIHDFANGIASMLDKMTPEQQRLIGGIVMAISGIVVALTLLAPMLSVLSSLATGLSLIGPVGIVAEQGLAAAGRGLGNFFQNLSRGLLGIGIATVAIGALMLAFAAIRAQYAKEEEAKARQIEGNVALAESFEEIGETLSTLSMSTFEKPIAGLQAMAQALGQFQNVDVDARATLTNLALISAGKAADSANNARIVAAGAANINNNINNSFAPSLVLEIDGEQFNAKVKRQVVETVTATN